MPEDVQIEIMPLTAELTTRYWLVVLYPRQGFFAVFEAEGTVINSIIHVCPRNVSPDLYLLAPNTYSQDQINEIISINEPHAVYQPLDAVTDIDTNEFYEIFRNQNTACVATNLRTQAP